MHSRFSVDLRGEKVGKLFEAEASVTVRIDPSDDGEDLCLDKVVAELAEEVLQVADRDGTLIVAVDRTEGSEGGVVNSRGKLSRHSVHPSNEVNLFLKEAHKL